MFHRAARVLHTMSLVVLERDWRQLA